MRWTIIAAAGLLGLAAVPVIYSATPRRAVVPVQVDVHCAGDEVSFTITPWTASLKQDDDIDWNLSDTSDTQEITIERKQGQSRWPYTAGPPYKGHKNDPAKGRAMKPSQNGQRFSYSISLVCKSGTNPPKTVIIDPDMVVE